jgi:hypothetical protein
MCQFRENPRLATRGGRSQEGELMTADQLAETLTRLAQFKRPYLAITVKRDGAFFNGRIIATHQGKTLSQFGSRLRRTLPELKDALCYYFTFEFEISPAKQLWIESEINRLNEKARAKRSGDV